MNTRFNRMNLKTLSLRISLLGILSVSSSYAQTWVQTSAPLTNWQAIASSANGRQLVAVRCVEPGLDLRGLLRRRQQIGGPRLFVRAYLHVHKFGQNLERDY